MKKKFFAILCFLLFPFFAFSQEKSEIEKIEKAIVHVVSGEMPKRFKIKKNLRNSMMRKPERRNELAKAIEHASEKWGIDKYLLVAIAFREGRFRKDVKSTSSIGERSTFQIAPITERFLRNRVEKECTTKTYRGAALCAASLLHVYAKSCGNMRGGITKYASGRSCIPKSKHLRWLTNDRVAMSLYLSKYVQD